MPKGTLFIQPHSDDMVMSLYFLTKAEILSRPYYLLTVFPKSNWMDPIKRRKLRPVKGQVAITRFRKGEDRQFAKLLHLTPLFLDFEDCLLREGKVYFRACTKLKKRLLANVSRSIESVIKKYQPQSVVIHLPSGIKQHYDHRIVYQAVQLITVSFQQYFVDDLPYGRIANLKKYNLQVFEKVKVKSLNEKFRAMKIYDSQICDLFFNQVKKITKQNEGYERLLVSKS